MAKFLNANNALSVTAAAISPSSTSVQLFAGDGAKFPAPGPNEYFVGSFAAGGFTEIVRVTSRVGDVLTMTRAQEGTTARTWAAGTTFKQPPTAAQMQDLLQDSELTSALILERLGVTAGPSGSVLMSQGPGNPPTWETLVKTTFDPVMDITAPAATYGAKCVIGGVQTIESFGSADGDMQVMLMASKLLAFIESIPNGMTSFSVYLYSGSPPSNYANNDPFSLTLEDSGVFLNQVNLGGVVEKGEVLFVSVPQQNIPLLVPEGGSLFAYFVTNGPFTITDPLDFKATFNNVLIG